MDFHDETLQGNEIIEEAIRLYHQEPDNWRLMGVCMAVRKRIQEDGHLVFPADISEDAEGNTTFAFKTLETDTGAVAIAAFTNPEKWKKGPPSGGVSQFIDSVFEPLLQIDSIDGVLLNPWGESIFLDKEDITVILNPGIERFM